MTQSLKMSSYLPRFALLALVIFLPVHTHAVDLDLEDAVQIARENSRVIEAADARAKAAGEMRWEAYGYLMPKIDVMEVAIRTNQPGDVFGLSMNRRENMVGLMGQAFGMGAHENGDLFTTGWDNDIMVDPAPTNFYITRVQAEMPLFTGGMITNRIRQARLMADAGELNAAREQDQVLFDVTTAWTNVSKAQEFLDLLQRAHSTTKAHVQMARDYHEAGFLVSSEVLRAEVYLAKMVEMVASARNGSNLARAALNFHMGIDQTTVHSLGTMPALPSLMDSLSDWTVQALSSRDDLEAARRQLKAGELEQWVAGSAFLPTLGVQANYDYYADEAFNMDDKGHFSVKGALSFNIFSGGSDRARVSKAKHNARAYRKDVERFEEGVRLQVQQAFGNYETAGLRHTAALASLDAGRENLRVSEDRFREGVAKMIDLLDAETALRELEVRELVARYDRHVAAWELRHAAGQDIVEF
jgi:outer membrane protein TolC